MNEILTIICNLIKILKSIFDKNDRRRDVNASIYDMVVKLDWAANSFFSSFYTLENCEEPYNDLENYIKDTYRKVTCLPIYVSLKVKKKAEEYVSETYKNLKFWRRRLEDAQSLSHSEWAILPDKVQQNGSVAAILEELKSLLIAQI